MMTRYIPVTGTGAEHEWHKPQSLLALYLLRQDMVPLTQPDGSPLFTWAGSLYGLWWQGAQGWRREAERLALALVAVPYEDRNVIGHSHGGNLVLFAAAHGIKIRTLTTIGTPRRNDVPSRAASQHIEHWQHVHDQDRDWIATMRRQLGQLGDWTVRTERRFLIPGVVNIGLKGIGHSALLSEPAQFHRWKDDGLLDGIRLR